jgi:hypothetical protein
MCALCYCGVFACAPWGCAFDTPPTGDGVVWLCHSCCCCCSMGFSSLLPLVAASRPSPLLPYWWRYAWAMWCVCVCVCPCKDSMPEYVPFLPTLEHHHSLHSCRTLHMGPCAWGPVLGPALLLSSRSGHTCACTRLSCCAHKPTLSCWYERACKPWCAFECVAVCVSCGTSISWGRRAEV